MAELRSARSSGSRPSPNASRARLRAAIGSWSWSPRWRARPTGCSPWRASWASRPTPRETDVLVATGEQVSAALLAIRLNALGFPARIVSGPSVEDRHRLESRRARRSSRSIAPIACMSALDDGNIAVVAGYPGHRRAGDITTLGPGRLGPYRGGAGGRAQGRRLRDLHRRGWRLHRRPEYLSDGAQARPHILRRDARDGGAGRQGPAARARSSSRGAINVPLVVRSSFNDASRHLGRTGGASDGRRAGFGRHARSESEQDYAGGRRGSARSRGADFRSDRRGRNYGRHDYPERQRRRPHRRDLHASRATICAARSKSSSASPARSASPGVRHEEQVAKVSIVGLGMRSHAGVAAKMFRCSPPSG